jgi:acyl-CoA hydrolase
MNFQELYQSKLASMDEVLSTIHDGDVICGGLELCEPTGFYSNFHKVAPNLNDIEIIKGKKGKGQRYPFLEMPELKGRVHVISHLFDKALSHANELGLASPLPGNLHDVMLRRCQYKPVINKFIAMATPMDENGNFVVSGCGMYEEEAYRHAEQVILEVNPNQPKFPGCLTIPLERVDKIVEENYPVAIYDVRSTPTEKDLIIGNYAAEFVHDGDCIQLGLGGMPDAVGNSFFDKHDLGLHTELFTPVMGDLIAAGVINGARKTIDRGKHVGNFILGDEKLYQIMSTDPNVMFSQASYTNDPFVISQIDNMVSINTAMEIDLTGQICSESIGPRQYSGTGGAFDFAYGAQHSKGGRGIIAINSTAKNGTISKIKAVLTPGSVVTISRNVADIIITEYGVAYMRGRSVRERALQLIAIAHPDFRGELTQQARAYGFI